MGAVEVITTIDLLKMLLLEVMFMMKRKETPSEDTPIDTMAAWVRG